MEKLSLKQIEKPSWADKNAYLNIECNKEIIGSLALVSLSTMMDAKIKHTNVALFEINYDKLMPFSSRTNKFKELSLYPLVEKDLSIIVDENITWKEIKSTIQDMVKEIDFIEEYKGNQIPKNKKSIMLRIKIGNIDSTMTSDQINDTINKILKKLNKTCGAFLREE